MVTEDTGATLPALEGTGTLPDNPDLGTLPGKPRLAQQATRPVSPQQLAPLRGTDLLDNNTHLDSRPVTRVTSNHLDTACQDTDPQEHSLRYLIFI